MIQVVSWNVRRTGQHAPKRAFLLSRPWDLAVLLEVTPRFWTALREEIDGVFALDLVSVKGMRHPHGVALLARNGWRLSEPVAPPLPEGPFESRPRGERWLSATARRDDEQVTLVGFHAPYAAGGDRAERLRNRARKRRAYEALTAWLRARPLVVVGMDGNNWWDPVVHVAPDNSPDSADFWSEHQFHRTRSSAWAHRHLPSLVYRRERTAGADRGDAS